MSTTSADAPSSAQANVALTEKQERPGRQCTFAATFDKTAAGVRFGNVETRSDKIIVSAEFDLSSVEVDFERLTGATGLENVKETKEIWESIKRLVKSDPPAKCAPETAEDALDVERELGVGLVDMKRRSGFLKQLCTAAHNVQLFAYRARLSELQERRKYTRGKANTQERENERIERIKVARDDVRRALSAENIANIQDLTTWHLDGLFGDKGLKNLDSHHKWRAERSQPKNSMRPEPRTHSQEDFLLLTLIGRVLDVIPKLFDNAEACGEAYQARLRLHAYFCEQQSALWRRFHQEHSAERRVLLQWAEGKGLLASYKHSSSKLKPNIPQLAWGWFQEMTGQSQSTIRGAISIGCHVKNMTALFGDSVLYFMDSCLETELSEITRISICNGEEVIVSVNSTLEVLVAQDLQKCCEAARIALSNSSWTEMATAIDDIREKLSRIAVDPSKIDALAALLYDIRHGRVKIFKSPDQDDVVHDAAESIDLNGNAPRVERMGERTGANARVVALKIPSTKRKFNRTTATNDGLSLHAKSSRGRAATTMRGQYKHSHGSGDVLVDPGMFDLDLAGLSLPLTHVGKRSSTNVHRAAPEARPIKRKHRATNTGDDASSLRAHSSGVRATAALPNKSKHSSGASSRPSSDNIVRRSTATHRSTVQDVADYIAAVRNSRSGKRKGEDGPLHEGNTLQAPMKRRMAMKEESFKGSQ